MAMNVKQNKTSGKSFPERIKSSISAKLTLTMMLCALLPLAAAWFLANTTGSADQNGKPSQETAARAADVVAQTLAKNVRMLQTLALSNDLRDDLASATKMYQGSQQSINSTISELNKQWTGAPTQAAKDALIKEITSPDPAVSPSGALLHRFRERFSQHQELLLTDKFGANLAATNTVSRYSHADEAWWQQAYQGGTGAIYIGKPGVDTGANSIVLAVPVISNSKQLIGVLRSSLDEKEIKETLSDIKPGKTSRVIIADADGTILFDSTKQTSSGQKLPNSLADALKSTRPGWLQSAALGNHDSIVGYAKPSNSFDIPALEKLQWTALAVIEPGGAFASSWTSLLWPLLLLALAIGIALLLARRLTAGFLHQINNIKAQLNQVRQGNIHTRAVVVSEDELGRLSAELNSIFGETLSQVHSTGEREELRESLMELLVEVSRAADGDLTVEAPIRADLTGDMARVFNRLTSEMRQSISRVQDVTIQVESSVTESQATNEHLTQSSENQALQMTAVREAIDGMTRSIRQVVETADTSKDVAGKSLSTAKRGAEAVQNTIKGMSSLREQVQETTKRIKRLGENSQEIGEIVKLIGDIAYRTSVLALNASIQAARAGEAGRGFAVVAEEVERLAKRSTEAAKRITDLVKTVQAGTNEAIAAMEDSTREVVEGSNLVYEAGQSLTEIESVSARLAELIQSISSNTERQARDSEAVFNTMLEISETTQQTTSGIKRSTLTANQLAALADDLRESVASFKLTDNRLADVYSNGQNNGHHYSRN